MTSPYDHAIILDLEATCSDTERIDPQEVIEFPSVLLDLGSGAVVDEFASFVRPVHHPELSAFCRELTTITQADVDMAPVFAEVFAAHQAWLEQHGLTADNAVVVTCGDWDLGRMLPRQCRVAVPEVRVVPPLYRRWSNLKVLFDEATASKRGGMVKMLRVLGLPLVGTHHRGLDDCRNLAAILGALLDRGATVRVTGELTD
jgi:inhibitor of KinA sporulation pathway (predicted exonuclease)